MDVITETVRVARIFPFPSDNVDNFFSVLRNSAIAGALLFPDGENKKRKL